MPRPRRSAECGAGTWCVAGCAGFLGVERAAATPAENPKRPLAILALRCSSADILCTAESVFCCLEGFSKVSKQPVILNALCHRYLCRWGWGCTYSATTWTSLWPNRGDRRPHRLAYENTTIISGRHGLRDIVGHGAEVRYRV